MSEHAIANAKAWLETIADMVKALDTDDMTAFDEAQQAIQEAPLSVMVRDDWRLPGDAPAHRGPVAYEILLSTGGPALRIRGAIDCDAPSSAILQWQDWGTQWTDYPEGEDLLIRFAEQFYLAE